MKKILIIIAVIILLVFLPLIIFRLFVAPIKTKTTTLSSGEQQYTNNIYSINFPKDWSIETIGSDSYPEYSLVAMPVPNPDHVQYMLKFELHRRYESLDPKIMDVLQENIQKVKKDAKEFNSYAERDIYLNGKKGIHYEYETLAKWFPDMDPMDKFPIGLYKTLFNYYFNRNKSGYVEEKVFWGGEIFVNSGDKYDISYRSSASKFSKHKNTFENITKSIKFK